MSKGDTDIGEILSIVTPSTSLSCSCLVSMFRLRKYLTSNFLAVVYSSTLTSTDSPFLTPAPVLAGLLPPQSLGCYDLFSTLAGPMNSLKSSVKAVI